MIQTHTTTIQLNYLKSTKIQYDMSHNIHYVNLHNVNIDYVYDNAEVTTV